MMFNVWPYLMRLAVAIYFLYPHGKSLLDGMTKLNRAAFVCVTDFIPAQIAFMIWHSLFLLLGLLILIWPRPVLPLLLALMVISIELYINFTTGLYAASNMLLSILWLVTFALTIYHASRSSN